MKKRKPPEQRVLEKELTDKKYSAKVVKSKRTEEIVKQLDKELSDWLERKDNED